MVGFLLWLSHDRNQNGYQIALNSYIDALAASDSRYSELELTAQAFSKARKKLPYTVVESLCTETAKLKQSQASTFKGLEVVALDGTGFCVPDATDLNEHFNKHKTYSMEAYLPQGNLVAAVHTRTKTISHAMVDCLHSSEKNLASALVDNFDTKTLFVLDRGFATHNLFKKIYNNHQHVVARIRTDDQAYRPFKNFSESGKVEEYIRLKNGVYLRLVRVNAPDKEEPLFLATTLPETMASVNQLRDLYKERWEVETVYDFMKNIQNLENFHARNFNGVMQELFAHFTLHNLTASCGPEEETEDGRLNRKQMVEVVGRKVLVLFIIGVQLPGSDLKAIVESIQKVAKKSRCKRRPGRKYPRISKQPRKKWNEGKHRTKELQWFRSLS